jgi:hypothetical protein
MKYESSLKILDAISDGFFAPLDIFEAIVESGYGASAKRIESNIHKMQRAREIKKWKREEERKRIKRFQSLIYKLKRDGLIEEKGIGDEMQYALTVAGEQKLEILKSKEGFPDTYYQKEKGDKVIIVMFDIPEDQTKKRTWLRMVLNNLDYKMAQKSVWIGKTKIPKELVADLTRMQLEGFVEIFEVGKTGNLRNLI